MSAASITFSGSDIIGQQFEQFHTGNAPLILGTWIDNLPSVGMRFTEPRTLCRTPGIDEAEDCSKG